MITEDDIKNFVKEINHPFLLLLLDRVTKERLIEVGVATNMGNPVGEYAEYLVATAFSGSRMPNANRGYDITLEDGTKIEVKGRIFEGNRVPMTYIKHSTIVDRTFDYLIYIVFNENMSVKYAMKISHSNFQTIATYAEPNNAPPKWIFVANQSLLDSPHVINITNEIRMVENETIR
jgi:hypothetical protein